MLQKPQFRQRLQSHQISCAQISLRYSTSPQPITGERNILRRWSARIGRMRASAANAGAILHPSQQPPSLRKQRPGAGIDGGVAIRRHVWRRGLPEAAGIVCGVPKPSREGVEGGGLTLGLPRARLAFTPEARWRVFAPARAASAVSAMMMLGIRPSAMAHGQPVKAGSRIATFSPGPG
jgi:hypothetical protein